MKPFRSEPVVGNRSLSRFDVVVIGGGTSGSAAAEVLARSGQKVLVLEAGSNYFEGLADPDPGKLRSAFSNDEVKQLRRFLIDPDPLLQPSTYRPSEADGDRTFVGDVNHLPRTVGGASVHSNITSLRFQPFDFELGRLLGDRWRGASFADWPLRYDELEPFYLHNELMLGVQGDGADNPFEPPRSAPYPMKPGIDAAVGYLVGESARRLGYHPYLTPHAIASEAYDGRPACAGCGFCGNFGCPSNAKGSAPVTSLRRALLTGNALLLAEHRAVRLYPSPSGREIRSVEAIGPDGSRVRFAADRYVLAASPVEDARLLFLSGDGEAIGNSSGLVGRNLTFHLLTSTAGVRDERLHSHRGKTVAMGFADFRGRPGDPEHPLGGIALAGGSGLPIQEAFHYAGPLAARGGRLRDWLAQSPMRDRMMGLTMYAEDAPQTNNRVDLDPAIRDVDGIPVARITYRHHEFELSARRHYLPKLVEVLRGAGAAYLFTAPIEIPSQSRHVFGTLRFGRDPSASVCNREGRFHDIGNLYAAGASLFPTASGYNPVLTISTLGSWVGASLLRPDSPAAALPRARAGRAAGRAGEEPAGR